MKRLFQCITWFLLLAVIQTCGGIAHAAQVSTHSIVDSTFAEVEELRARGQFDLAIERLNTIIQEHKRSDTTMRRAYNDLVLTYLLRRDATADKKEHDLRHEELIARSREALQIFPDLEPDPTFPPEVFTIYGLQRQAMFGQLAVTSNIDSCRVFLIPREGGSEQGSYRGMTPLTLKLVPVGNYRLTVTRSGYRDREAPLTISPSAVIQKEVILSRERTTKWWLTRVFAPAAAVGGIVAAIVVRNNGDDTADTTHPLDEPPPPPAR